MADCKPYKAALGIGSEAEIKSDFLSTLSLTNRNSAFFVDWKKVNQKTEEAQIRLHILNSLLDSKEEHEAEERFIKLILQYPETITVLPLLIASHENALQVLNDFDNNLPFTFTFDIDFSETIVQSEKSIADLTGFLRGAGIFQLMCNPKIHDLVEYVFGVEVGMDTNARKNRSGTVMESVLQPLIEDEVSKMADLVFINQCNQNRALEAGLHWPLARNRRMDFALWKKDKHDNPLCIETNFFNVSGSKAGVAASYIDRQNELQSGGWEFALVTDGPGWQRMANDLAEIIEKLKYVMNLDQVRRGLLSAVIEKLYIA